MKGLLVLPVLNASRHLMASIHQVVARCSQHREVPFDIVIYDNGSTDDTPELAWSLTTLHPNVFYRRSAIPGRGRALREAWLASKADVRAYMDIDLATDLDDWPSLINPLIEGRADLVIGNRRHVGSRVSRRPARRFFSVIFHLLAGYALGVRALDLQCGFKAIGGNAALLLRDCRENEWLFDAELIALAERSTLRVMEVPVRWTESQQSTVLPIRDAWRSLASLVRIRGRLGRAAKSGLVPAGCPRDAVSFARPASGPLPERRGNAFTLVELLVTISVIAIVAALSLQSLAAARNRGASTTCMSNLRQLQQQALLYSDDHQQRLVPNAAYFDGRFWRSASNSWTGHNSAETDFDEDSLTGALGAGKILRRIAKCPADRSETISGDRPRLRSFSLNSQLAGNPPRNTDGSRLRVLAQHEVPNPSETFSFIAEHEHTIDDGSFLAYSAPVAVWANVPSSRHARSENVAYCDGSVSQRRWKTPKLASRNPSTSTRTTTYPVSGDDKYDLLWLQHRMVPNPGSN
jgi:prepilin-type N-terminal cleavage/methylation domain-containing protein